MRLRSIVSPQTAFSLLLGINNPICVPSVLGLHLHNLDQQAIDSKVTAICVKPVWAIFDVSLIQQLATTVTALTLAPATRREARRAALTCSSLFST